MRLGGGVVVVVFNFPWRGGQVEVHVFEALGAVQQQPPAVQSDLVGVAVKLLTNLAQNFEQDKFHKVRLGNKTFDKKVGSVPGGLDVMVAAGFELTTDENDEPVLQYPAGPEAPPRLLYTLNQLGQLSR